MDDTIALDDIRLKALSSKTRKSILKLLSEKNYTLSGIASKLNLSKPSVKEHLALLVDAGLIKKISSENIWIYYRLTSEGTKITAPSGAKMLLLFGISIISTFVVGLYLAMSSLTYGAANITGTKGITADAETFAVTSAESVVAGPTMSSIEIAAIIFVVLLS